MGRAPKVTVRMSAYNHEAFVEEAILSILNQTYQDFELIVIDDGSTDRTPDLIGRLSREYGFQFKRQENQGIAKAYNQLVRSSRGTYITGCASDDYWPPTRLEQQVALLDSNPGVDLVHGRAVILENGKAHSNSPDDKTYVHGRNEFLPLIRWQRHFVTGTKMLRLDAFKRVGFYREDLMVEDFEWWLRATRCLTIHFENAHWLYYRRHEGNFIRNPATAGLWSDDYYKVCRGLGLRHGLICFRGGLPLLIRCDNTARRLRRIAYYLFFFDPRVRRSLRHYARGELRGIRNHFRRITGTGKSHKAL